MTKKLPPSKAIAVFCKECIYDPHGGNGSWINQIEECTAPECPLYEHRPLTGNTREILREEKVAAMSPEELIKYKKRQDGARNNFILHNKETQ